MSKKVLRICYAGFIALAAFMMVIALKKEGTIAKAGSELSGEGTMNKPYLIQNEEDYVAFAKAVNVDKHHYANQFITITTDLDFSKINATVGLNDDQETYFQGILDGAGHKISNVNINNVDSAAGLFLNLNGMIVNLQVDSGTIVGSDAGAIAGSVHNSAKVINCCNKAAVIGDTTDGIIGEFIGEMENCYGIGMDVGAEYADQLNASLDTLSVNEEYHNWCRWAVEDGEITLTENVEPVLNVIKTDIHMDDNVITLKAFASSDGNWYFALPSGYNHQERLTITAAFQDGEVILSELKSGETETTISCHNKEYHIILKTNENTASIFMTTDVKQGVQYLASSKENTTRGSISVFDEEGAFHYSGFLNELTGRGNDSYIRSSKKGYNVSLKERVNILGMGENEDFVLLSGYRDNCLLTYKVTQDMEKETGIAYAPDSRFVNLYVNNQYLGMYFLTEKIEIDQNRYEISDVKYKTQQLSNVQLSSYSMKSENNRFWYDIPVNPNDITGGYILELDCNDYTEDQSRFKSDRSNVVTIKSDKYATKEQVNYLADYWQDYEDAVFSETGYNDKGIYYTEYIDLESFADQWLMYEINSETSMRSSIYLYKESEVDGDGLLHAGYVWDVEHSFLNSSTRLHVAGRQYKDLKGYWSALYKHPDFAQKVLEEWNAKFKPAIEELLSKDADQAETMLVLDTLDNYQQTYAVSADINQLRWADCCWDEKVESISAYLTTKKDFLSMVLPMYDSEYDYLEVKDGVFYGANHVWDEDGKSDVSNDVYEVIKVLE